MKSLEVTGSVFGGGSGLNVLHQNAVAISVSQAIAPSAILNSTQECR